MVKFCIYYIPFVIMKIIFFITYIIVILEYLLLLLKVYIREITLLKTRKGDSPLKSSGPDCACANTNYFIY